MDITPAGPASTGRNTIHSLQADSRQRFFLYLLLAAFVGLVPVVFVPTLYDDFTLPKQVMLLCVAGVSLVLLAFSGSRLLPAEKTVTFALVGLFAVTTISLLLGSDIRHGLLGYYQYREGYLSQAAMLLLCLAAMHVGRRYSLNAILWAGVSGFLVACIYTAVQSTGHDPFDWWIDTSERAIGTIGNANELAGFILIAFAFGGVLAAQKSPLRELGLMLFSVAITFAMLASESRSALYCAGIMLIAFPISCAIVRTPRKQTVLAIAAILVGVGLGLLPSLQTGSAQATVTRVTHTVPLSQEQDEANNYATLASSTRIAMWKGAIPVMWQAPFFGQGPDGIVFAFPKVRPENLAGYFRYLDLPVQSSHNWFLDQASNGGFLGLGFLLLFLSIFAYRTIRYERGRGDVAVPYIWSALAAYAAFTMLNQLSIGVHAIFFVLLGLLLGRTVSLPARPDFGLHYTSPTVWPLRYASLAVCAGLTAVSLFAVLADLQADSGWGSSVNQNFVTAARQYARAASLNPFERTYLQNEATNWLAAGACNANSAYLKEAEGKFTVLNERFEPTAADLLSLAKVKVALGASPAALDPVLVRAKEVDPKSVFVDQEIQELRDASLLRNYVLVYRGSREIESVLLMPMREAAGLDTKAGCVIVGPRSTLPITSVVSSW